jgi:hypothetical protein
VPEIRRRVEMPVDGQYRTGNGLWRLYDKMALKQPGMAYLGDEDLRFIDGIR